MLIVIDDIDELNYYSKVCVEKVLSVRRLQNLIKSNEYNRLPVDTKKKIINNDALIIKDLVPNPILIRNKNNIEIINEKFYMNWC